ncbi:MULTISPECIES: hybrid sensor histidine kinase/response regulator transcription factor [unclassified Carboxylicivirga]|uniref:hybrid sensor histidine kinase/response regulator transcription factor n=1 Tax=Carboxylicivirga TaxID=1628153 RepID=UPI003D3423DA
MRYTILILLVYFLYAPTLSAQTQPYYFSGLDTENGLSNNSVNEIMQDRHGYMWISTYYGLNRYNGYEVNTYFSISEDESTLSSNFITCLQEDNNGDLWVGTKFGLNVRDKDTEKFTRFWADEQSGTSLRDNHIGDLILDKKNRLWIATMGGGLHHYNHTNNTFQSFAQNDSLGNYINMVNALCEGSDGNLWLGTYGQGLSLFDTQNNAFINYRFPTMQINDLLDDGNGNIWIATDNMGLYRFDKMTREYERFVGHTNADGTSLNIIMSLGINKDGTLLAAVDGGGIVNIDPLRKVIIKDKDHNKALAQLDTKAVFTTYIDNNGLYWVGTIGKGVRIINTERNRFQHFVHQDHLPKSLSDNVVLSLLQDSKNRIWVGTDGGGLNLFNPEKETFKRYNRIASNLKSNVIKRIFEDNKGTIWLGTYGSGLAQLDEQRDQLITHNPALEQNDGPLSISVWSLAQQDDNKLWVGTLGNGLYQFDTQTKVFTALSDIFPELDEQMNEYILSLFVDSKNNLWIGTSNGIYLWHANRKTYRCYLFDKLNDSGVGKNAILCINESSNGNIWMGSNGGGIFKIDPTNEAITNLTINDGLAQEQVYDIAEVHPGILWFASHGGLSKYEVETGRFQNYDNRDGLVGSTFNALLYTSNKQLLVGGVRGINRFNPEVIKVNNKVPKVLLSELYINNSPVKAGEENSPLKQNIANTQSIVLKHNQSNISIEFVAINYFISEKNVYSYMLENSSEEWSKPTTDRRVKYNNLKAGEYIFKVKAANNDGVWTTSDTTLQIKVLAPWWKRWYAYLAYLIIIVGMMYAYIRYTVLWMDLKRKLEFEVLEREKINELNHLRMQFFTNISHEFRTPLTLISAPLESLKKRLKLNDEEEKLFNIAHKNTRLLLRLINQVMDFRKVETGAMELNIKEGDIIACIRECGESFRYMAQERNMQFVIKSSINTLTLQFDDDIVEKVVYNLLSNAFKYGKTNGHVSLNISFAHNDAMEKQALLIEVKDDGEGIDSANANDIFKQYKRFHQGARNVSGTGIGLALTKSLVELHGGQITVTSEKGIGTCFTVSIPVLNSPLHQNGTNTEAPITIAADDVPSDMAIPLEHIDQSKHKILIVDDNPQVLEYLTTLLSPYYHLLKASDGQAACDILERRTVNLVLTDVMMPVMNGIELCKAIKTNLQTSHIPVIMLTAKASVENRIEGLNTGADAYVPKPFNPDVLLAYIDNLLKGRQKLQEIFMGKAIVLPSEITTTSVDEAFISNTLDIVRANMADEAFGVEELGNELGMSRSHLHRKIKALTGKSGTDFIRTVRLKEAAAKLICTDDQVSEIAYKVGFNSSSYFIKSFKKEFDMSPGQYKQSRRRWAAEK